MKSDLIGYISILHLRIADKQNPGCDQCLKLAELASQAVDFPKTGTPVDFRHIPRISETHKPDFLCPEGSNPDSRRYYPSQKVLGKLFRNVPMESSRHEEETEDPESPPTDGPKIREALSTLQSDVLWLPDLPDPSDDLRNEMEFILHQYAEQLSAISSAHALSDHPNHYLTEAELVSGTIESTWSNHRGRQEAVTAMNFQASSFINA